MKKFIVLQVVLLIIFCAGCAEKNEPPPPPQMKEFPAYVMAEVNGIHVIKAAFDQKMQEMTRENGVMPQMREVVEEIIDDEVIAQEAVKQQPLPANLSPEAAGAQKKAAGQRLNNTKKEELRTKIKVEEKDLSAYLEKNKPPQEIELWQMAFSNEPLAQEASAYLKSATDFKAAAKKYFVEESSLGAVKRGQLEPALETAAFKLPEGEVSPVIATGLGYYILKRVPLSADYVKKQVYLAKEKELRQWWLWKLRRKAKIAINQNYF